MCLRHMSQRWPSGFTWFAYTNSFSSVRLSARLSILLSAKRTRRQPGSSMAERRIEKQRNARVVYIDGGVHIVG